MEKQKSQVKNIWLIVVALVAGIVLGRLSIEPKVVTQTVTEYHALNTSALTAIKISEPIGSKIERVKLIYLREDNHLRDTTKKVEGLPNGLSNQPVTDSNAFVTAELPIRDFTFTDDSTYRIVARGVYVESLPQIEFTPQIVMTTRTEKIDRTPRITHGFQLGAGAALTPKGLQPAMYFGYGFSIKF